MATQKSDLIRSRHELEQQGESFGCFRCGAELLAVVEGGASDLCASCDDALAAEIQEAGAVQAQRELERRLDPQARKRRRAKAARPRCWDCGEWGVGAPCPRHGSA